MLLVDTEAPDQFVSQGASVAGVGVIIIIIIILWVLLVLLSPGLVEGDQ